MDRIPNRPPGGSATDDEFIDTLIAVSVIAKRLAENLRNQTEKASRCPCCDGARKAR